MNELMVVENCGMGKTEGAGSRQREFSESRFDFDNTKKGES
jgi:hypothetical protein